MPQFQTAADCANEDAVAEYLHLKTPYRFIKFGGMSALDWYFTHDGTFAGVAELKCRNVTHDTYPTVFLSVRKWMALITAGTAMSCRAFFIVRFTDKIMRISVWNVDASRVVIAGRTDRGAQNDQEPIIEVPIGALREV